jgi:hypothetical protein
LITAAKYWSRWDDPRLIVLVLNDRDLSFVTWEQRASAGDPRFEASQELPDVPYARWAEAIGLKGRRVDDPDDVAEAWEEALAADRPAVYEAVVDAEVPPMPPHVSFDQARLMTRALYRGDPAAPEIIRHAFAELVEEYMPRRREKGRISRLRKLRERRQSGGRDARRGRTRGPFCGEPLRRRRGVRHSQRLHPRGRSASRRRTRRKRGHLAMALFPVRPVLRGDAAGTGQGAPAPLRVPPPRGKGRGARALTAILAGRSDQKG